MDVLRIIGSTVEKCDPDDLPALLEKRDGLIWVDVPHCDTAGVALLREVFNFHPVAIDQCVVRNRIPRFHLYPDHRFYVLHSPQLGAAGHVHYVELDHFVGDGFVVTVHGPVNEAVDPAVMNRETGAVRRRLETGRWSPAGSFELSHAIVAGIVRTVESAVEQLTEQVWRLEQQMTGGDRVKADDFLEQMFQVRHGLLAVRTIASSSCEIYRRVTHLRDRVPAEGVPLLEDLADQFERVGGLANIQWEYLQGVIDFFRARTETTMSIATERLAVIAAVTLPITAIASVYGMNFTHIPELNWRYGYPTALGAMAVISALLLRWARRQGWW
jgi:magnesium/cobalt transport protein CorA